MNRTRTHLDIADVQQRARKLLDIHHVPPRRYGTAFHLSPPMEDVRELSIPLIGTGVSLDTQQIDLVAALVDGTPDPYLLWYLANISQAPIDVITTVEGEKAELVRTTSGCTFVFLAPHSSLSFSQDIIDEEVGVNRVFVWQAENSVFTYWGVRGHNAFLTERVHVELLGRGATTNVRHLTWGHAKEQADMQVGAYHKAPATESSLLVRSAAADRSVMVYRGLIDIAKEGRGSKGYQSARTLLLSRQAVVDSLPELAINTNDVQCSHGVTTTHVDDAALFYMRSRGIARADAKQLAITGFYHDKIDIPQASAATLSSLIARPHE